MTADEIQRAIADITAESDPTLKHLKLASLVSAGFRERGEVETDWVEVRRLAESGAYDNWNEVKQLVHEQAQALQVRNPCDSDA